MGCAAGQFTQECEPTTRRVQGIMGVSLGQYCPAFAPIPIFCPFFAPHLLALRIFPHCQSLSLIMDFIWGKVGSKNRPVLRHFFTAASPRLFFAA
jgi:hypothetical protein